MPNQDTTEVKEKIVSYIRQKGPALPVHVAREIGISSLFISAYLSELISAKKLKVSKMKVGNSPLYYIPGQESQLENFSTHLKPQEKEALEYLKEKEVLKDSDLDPATRVALQSVEDFAIPFENSGDKYWKYMTVSEEDALTKISETGKTGHSEEEMPHEENVEKEAEETSENKNPSEESDSAETNFTENPPKDEEQNQVEKEPSSPPEYQEPKFESPLKDNEEEPQNKVQEEKPAEEAKTKKKTSKKSASKKSSSDKTNKFFNKVKEHLSEQDIEINDILGIGKDELILKINENGGEKLLVAFNKNKLDENDFIKAHKKASDYETKFTVLSKQGALKKIENLLEAFGKMDSVKSMK